VLCALVFVFLIAPILIVIPLSFNAEPYFTFTNDADAGPRRLFPALV
jgi:ABC-type spermidine/putrescine transport system permease subunit II